MISCLFVKQHKNAYPEKNILKERESCFYIETYGSCMIHVKEMHFSTIQFSLTFTFSPQLENIGNFVRAITEYGLKPHDIFEANDLFENVNHTQVQSTLITLAGMVRANTHTHIHTQVQSKIIII